jgi:hypothetical protein
MTRNARDTVAPAISMRTGLAASLHVTSGNPASSWAGRGGVATDEDARAGVTPTHRVPVPQRVRVEQLMAAHPRAVALRFARLEQGWIDQLIQGEREQ